MEPEEESDELRSERQQRILNVRKVKSRDAARNRRSKENTQYLELAKLLPFPSSVTSQLDKASIIRLSISYLKYQELTNKAFRKRKEKCLTNSGHTDDVFTTLFGEDLGVHLLQALDGFLFCVSQDGKFIYISETVTTHLGLSQLDLIGTNVFNIIHPDDQKGFAELLNRNLPNSYHSLPFHAFDDFDAMTSNEMQYNLTTNQESISTFTRMKCALIKRAGCYVKSSGYKVIHVSGKLVPYRNIDRNGYRSHTLVATGQPLPPPTICELKLDTKVFVSRVSMDLKVVFCEGRIHKYMNFKARDIVGLSAYEFYHSNDMHVVQKGHSECLTSGKCITSAYRWINKSGGYLWMQTVGTVIKRHGPFGEESQILCVNYISSEVEDETKVFHKLQQHFKQMGVNDHQNESDSYDDYGIDNRHLNSITSSDITSLCIPPNQKNSENVMDKEAFLKAVRYDTVWYDNNVNEVHLPPSIENTYGTSGDDGFDPLDDLGVPYSDRIPSLQETLEKEETDRLMTEIMTDAYGVEFNVPDYTCSSESGFSDMSPGQGGQVSANASPPDVSYPLDNIATPSGFKPDNVSGKNTHPRYQQYPHAHTISSNVEAVQRYVPNPISNNEVFHNNNYFQNNNTHYTHNSHHTVNTIIKSELPSPLPRQVIGWRNTPGCINNNDSVVYLQHPTQFNNIVENSVAMDIGSSPNYHSNIPCHSGNINCHSGNISSCSPGDLETMSLLKQLEYNQNGYLNDISIEPSIYGCHATPIAQRDYP